MVSSYLVISSYVNVFGLRVVKYDVCMLEEFNARNAKCYSQCYIATVVFMCVQFMCMMF